MSALEADKVDEPYRLEYFAACALLALKKQDKATAQQVVQNLQSLDLSDLYFQRTRDQLCITLVQFATRKDSDLEASSALDKIMLKIRHITKSVELKPNICGFGIDLKKLFSSSNGSRRSK